MASTDRAVGTNNGSISERLIYEQFIYRFETTVPDLADRLAIPTSTVVGLVAKLEKRSMVTKVATAAGGKGRPKTVYRVCLPHPTMACSLDGTRVACAYFGRDLQAIDSEKKELAGIVTVDEAVEQIRSVIEIVKTRNPATTDHPEVALTANAFASSNGTLNSTVLPFISRLPHDTLTGRFDFPVRIVGSPYLLGEYHKLPEPVPENFTLFHVGDGISAHSIVNGKIAQGTLSEAGEVGHISRNLSGPLCRCGKRGCLEATCSGPALVRSVIADLETGVRCTVSPEELAETPTEQAVELIWRGWRDGDTYLTNRMAEFFDDLAWGVGTVVVLFDPQTMVFGGYVFESREPWLSEITNRLGRWVFDLQNRTTEYRLSASDWLDTLQVGALQYHHLLEV